MKRGLSWRLTQTPYNLAASFSILPRRVVSRLHGFIHSSNSFDFHICAFRQRRDLDGGTSRGILFEIGAIYFVYRLEVAKIGEENGCLNNGIGSEPLGSQNGCDVVQYSPGLRGDIAGNDLARFRVERNLATAKKEVSAAHRLRVGADRGRRFVRGNDLLHAGDCNCKSNRHNEWHTSWQRFEPES